MQTDDPALPVYDRPPVVEVTPANPISRSEPRETQTKISSTLRRTPWFDQIRSQLQEFIILKDNWNGYGETPIHEDAIKRTIAVLDAVTTEITPRPDVVPTSTGGVQIEWASNGFEIEVEVPPINPIQIFIVEPSKQEHELLADSINQPWNKLRDCLNRLGSFTSVD